MFGDSVNNLDMDPINSMFSPLKRQYGNPIFNILMSLMTGNNYMPQPLNGQSMYDSLIQRERSRQFAQLQASSFGNNALFKNLGIEGSPIMSMLGMMAASPDSMTGKLLNNVLGGNPMAASMQLYAGLAGSTQMGAFGRLDSISAGETESVMQSLANNFYKRQEYEGSGGIREGLRKDTTAFLTRQAERGPEGIEYLKSLGITGLKLDSDGKLDAESLQKIGKYDITSGAPETRSKEDVDKKIRETSAAGAQKDITSLLKETDDDIKKQLDDRLEKQLLARKIATKKQLDAVRNETGLLDPSKVKTIVDDFVSGQTKAVEDTAESTQARQQIADDLSEGLKSTSTKSVTKTQIDTVLQKMQDNNVISPKQAEEIKKRPIIEQTKKIEETITNFRQGKETLPQPAPAPISFAEKMSDQIAEKEKTANQLSSAIEGLKLYKNNPEKIKEYNSRIEDILKNSPLKAKPEDLVKYKTGENFDTEKLEPLVSGLGQRSEDERLYIKSKRLEQQGFRYKNFDFEKSRGFKLEDFTSAFARAADVRALGDSRNLTPAEAMSRFSENAGGALSAARSVFGNKSGAELVSNMSELVGSSNMDLGSEEGAGKMEDLLRRVKATQRTAGISIQTMLAIIKSGQELAANNPNLQFANSSATTELALKAVRTAADMGSSMSGADFRQAGGSQAMAMKEIQESQAFAQSGLGNSIAAFYSLAKGKKFTDPVTGEEKDATEELNRMSEAGELTGSGLATGGFAKIAEMLGISTNTLANRAGDPVYAQEAMKDEDIMKNVLAAKDASVMTTLFTGLENRGKGSKEEVIEKYKKAKQEGKTDNEFLLNEIQPHVSDDFYLQYKQTIQKGLRDSLKTPEERKKVEDLINKQALEDTIVSRELDSKRAPIVTQVVEAMGIGQEFGQEAAEEAFANIFTTKDITKGETKKAVSAARESATRLSEVTSNKNLPEAERAKESAQEINKILTARSRIAAERGEKTDIKANFTAEKLNLLKGLKDLGSASTLKDARQRLEELEKRDPSTLSPSAKKDLETLRAAKESGYFSSEQSYQQARKGTIEGLSAGVVQSYADEEVKNVIDKRKKLLVNQMGERLQQQAESNPVDDADKAQKENIRKAMEHYTKTDASGKKYVDWAEMYEDRADINRKKEASKGQKENYFAKQSKAINDKYKTIEEKLKKASETSTDDSKAVRKTQEDLIQELKNNGFTEEQLKHAKKEDDTYDLNKLLKFISKKKEAEKTKTNSQEIKRETDSVTEKLRLEETSLSGQGKAPGEDLVQKELIDGLRNLREMIGSGGGIKTALEELARALIKN